MATVTFSAADDVLYAYLAGVRPARWCWILAGWDLWIPLASG